MHVSPIKKKKISYYVWFSLERSETNESSHRRAYRTLLIFKVNVVLCDFHCVPKPATLTLGQRFPYCGTTAFLLFTGCSPSRPVLLNGEHRAAVSSSTLSAHSSMTVITTSTDCLCINNNIPVWLVRLSSVTCFHCCQRLLLLEPQIIEKQDNEGDILLTICLDTKVYPYVEHGVSA